MVIRTMPWPKQTIRCSTQRRPPLPPKLPGCSHGFVLAAGMSGAPCLAVSSDTKRSQAGLA